MEGGFEVSVEFGSVADPTTPAARIRSAGMSPPPPPSCGSGSTAADSPNAPTRRSSRKTRERLALFPAREERLTANLASNLASKPASKIGGSGGAPEGGGWQTERADPAIVRETRERLAPFSARKERLVVGLESGPEDRLDDCREPGRPGGGG